MSKTAELWRKLKKTFRARRSIRPEPRFSVDHKYPLDRAHVDNNGKPLCNAAGHFFRLCSKEDFEKARPRCNRCEQRVGIKSYGSEMWRMSKQQEQLLITIYERTGGAVKGDWCLGADLRECKSHAARTSLLKSLRGLEQRGLIERQRKGRRVLVRLAVNCIEFSEAGKPIVLMQE